MQCLTPSHSKSLQQYKVGNHVCWDLEGAREKQLGDAMVQEIQIRTRVELKAIENKNF